MDTKRKAFLQMILGILLLAAIFWLPEMAVVIGIVWLIWCIYKKVRHIPIIKYKKQRIPPVENNWWYFYANFTEVEDMAKCCVLF